MKQLKVLVVCEHASNVFGGEAMLPLNYCIYLAKAGHIPFLVTHARVKQTIEKIPEIDQSRVFYVPDTFAHRFLDRYSAFLPDRIRIITAGFLMHLITQYYQWRLARKVIRTHGIDVVHEPAPVSAVQPSAMFGLGVPVVIGPMNGGMSFPPAFQHMAGLSERALYKFMRLMASIYNLLIPGKFLADVLVVANARTQQVLPKLRLGRVVEIVENGVFSVAAAPKPPQNQAVINVIYVGRLVDWKAIDIAIDAVAQCQANVKLHIVGDGPLRADLTSYAQQKAPERVVFLGLVPHREMTQHYDNADIFVLTSIRECGGAVVLEAMSRGLPVIATDWGGPADYITADSGFLVKPTSRTSMVEQFASTIDQLAQHPELRYNIGKSAIQRISSHFLWDKKVADMVEIYQQAINDRQTR